MQTGKLTYFAGYEGTGAFHFEGITPKGRSVAVDVPAEVIIKLAELMRHTKSVGHAAWHVREGKAIGDCSSCNMSPNAGIERL